jgi:hypothetical protein
MYCPDFAIYGNKVAAKPVETAGAERDGGKK